MFLLMGIGYLVAVSVLVSEIVGGCAKRCRQFARRNSKVTFGDGPRTSKRISSVSQSGDIPISAQEKLRKIILNRFRRNSEPIPRDDSDNRRGHKRADSIFVSANPSSSGQLTDDDRWNEAEGESHIDRLSIQNEMDECGGSTSCSMNDEMEKAFHIEAQSIQEANQCSPSPNEFGEIVQH